MVENIKSSLGVSIVKSSGSRQETLAALKLLAIKELAFQIENAKCSNWVPNGRTLTVCFVGSLFCCEASWYNVECAKNNCCYLSSFSESYAISKFDHLIQCQSIISKKKISC